MENFQNNNKNYYIDIQPKTDVYSTFSRLSYKTHTAIAEFIDNSTASFFKHEKELLANDESYKLRIYIFNDIERKEIEIFDNAYGMEQEDFHRAFMINAKPKDKTGRNEFGMGLKTAACWFAKTWTIKSSQLHSNKLYKASLDTAELERTKQATIPLETLNDDFGWHGTQIILKNLNKSFSTKRQKKILLEQLASTYRLDITRGKIEIRYVEKENNYGKIIYKNIEGHTYGQWENISPLQYEYPEFFIENDDTELKKSFSDFIEFEGKRYDISGVIGVRETGDRKYGGFSLLRRGRVIIGGPDSNYYNSEIFGSKNGFVYLRLFGEIYLNEWPVTQAKDNFDWENGLEDQFIEKMKEITAEYRHKCETIRKDKPIKLNPKKVITDNTEISEGLKQGINFNLNNNFEIKKVDVIEPNVFNDKTLDKTFAMTLTNNETIELNYSVNEKEFSERWLVITENENKYRNYNVVLYRLHPFFKDLKIDEDFLFAIRKFVISLSATIIKLKYINNFAKIDPMELLATLNDLLKFNFKERK
ncbi:ATP-binding protein [Spiroplasma endosymbiont of Amphibalanus improvisus]|uniref:ATP-binding protein n=1 Tax=Spiroplasma endosymbiont of Amphibalanus improvisus TaxID=3066327 RepID=UPI00313D9017